MLVQLTLEESPQTTTAKGHMQDLELFTRKEVANMLKISITKLDELRGSGQITERRIGSRIRFSHKDIKDYLDTLD